MPMAATAQPRTGWWKSSSPTTTSNRSGSADFGFRYETTQPRLSHRADHAYLIEIIDGAIGPSGFFAAIGSAKLRPPSDESDRIGASVFRSHGGSMTAAVQEVAGTPDMKVSVRQVFGIDSDLEVPAYSQA